MSKGTWPKDAVKVVEVVEEEDTVDGRGRTRSKRTWSMRRCQLPIDRIDNADKADLGELP